MTRPHGVRGELNAIPLVPPVLEAGDLIIGRTLTARDAEGRERPVVGQSVRPHKGRWLIRLEGVETVEAVDLFRGFDLCLPRSDLPPLPEGWYWEADLRDCRVIDARLGEIGRAESLDVATPQAHLRVCRPDGRIAAIPWTQPLIVQVDLKTGQIHTDLPDQFPGVSDEPPRNSS